MRFNEEKAAQAAARFLSLRGENMSYLKLIKLLYFVDREALLRWGRPVTTDRYVSMDNGPVVSQIYDLITDGPRPSLRSAWHELISQPQNYEVGLVQNPPPSDELSIAEERLIDEVFGQFGRMSRWELVELSHKLPEWQDPEGSALPIDYEQILRAAGRTAEEASAIVQELCNLAVAQSVAQRGA